MRGKQSKLLTSLQFVNMDFSGQLFYYMIGFNFVVEYALIILPFMSVQNILKHTGSYV